MAKFTLILEEDLDFDLIGICSHHSDYRLCWAINNQLGLKLKKSDEFYHYSGRKGNIISSHSFYEWFSEEDNVSYYFIKNKDGEKDLIPEKAQIDYFLVVKESEIINIDDIVEKLRSLNEVLTVFSFDPYELKSANRLIF